MTIIFWFLIGLNIGMAIGWFLCEKFKGDMEKFRRSFDE